MLEYYKNLNEKDRKKVLGRAVASNISLEGHAELAKGYRLTFNNAENAARYRKALEKLLKDNGVSDIIK